MIVFKGFQVVLLLAWVYSIIQSIMETFELIEMVQVSWTADGFISPLPLHFAITKLETWLSLDNMALDENVVVWQPVMISLQKLLGWWWCKFLFSELMARDSKSKPC